MNGRNTQTDHLHTLFIKLHELLYDFLVVQKIVFLSNFVGRGSRLALYFVESGQSVRCKDFINGLTTIATKILIIKLNATTTAIVSTMITG